MTNSNKNSAPIYDLLNDETTTSEELTNIYHENWFDSNIILAVAKNPNTPPSLLKNIFITFIGGADAVFSNIAMNLLLLENPCLIKEWCEESLRTYYSKAVHKGQLSRNPIEEIQSIELQLIIYEFQDKRIWLHQLSSEYTAPEIYSKILDSIGSEVIQDRKLFYTVLSNPNCCPRFLHRVLTSSNIDFVISAWQQVQLVSSHITALIEYRYSHVSNDEADAYRWAYSVSLRLFEFYSACKWRHFRYRGRKRLTFGENLLKYIEFRSIPNYKDKIHNVSNILLVFLRNRYVLAIDVDSDDVIFANATVQEQAFISSQIEFIPFRPRKRRRS